jgi:hypothetical protein
VIAVTAAIVADPTSLVAMAMATATATATAGRTRTGTAKIVGTALMEALIVGTLFGSARMIAD